ncbi:hypothetical protein C0Q70_04566 [Pomacea canaliculata]|uniref:Major facilitator superfamily (MFS) profile domain-containing protein n=1 Tax=Pomacea canaliculata TaxID=400727 RepID=A0A2T7PIQ9_POMCA|nr:hypothetical protein C0Q70_04566 [Pomacea canaliculata]
MATHRPESEAIGRRRWLVVVSCFVSALATGSASYHTGVLYVALLDVFQKDVVTTSWLGAIYSCTFALSGPLASTVVNRFNCRVSLVLAGLLHFLGLGSCYFITSFPLLYPALIIAGIGQGLSITGTSISLLYHFPDKNTLVSGICVCGSGLGVFIHPSLMQTYGLHGALLIAGAIGLHSVPCGLLMPLSRFERDRRKNRQDQETSSLCACPNVASYLYVITYLRFLVYLISLFNVSVAASSYYLYVPKYLILNGYSHLKASFIISFTGVGSIISRLLSGVASLDPGVDNILIYGGIIFIAALVAFLIPVTVNSTVAQFVLAVLYGLYTGGSYALLGPLVLEILGVRHVSTGTGLCMFAAGIGSLVGPPISGMIYVAQHNFHHAFYFIASLFGAASVCAMCTALFPRREGDARAGELPALALTSRLQDGSPLLDNGVVVVVVEDGQLELAADTEFQTASREPFLDHRGIKEGFPLLEDRTDPVDEKVASANQT